jgi:hypothetical protein
MIRANELLAKILFAGASISGLLCDFLWAADWNGGAGPMKPETRIEHWTVVEPSKGATE